MKKPKALLLVANLCAFGLIIFLFVGFYFSDPYFFDSRWKPNAYRILQSIRLSLPFCALVLLLLLRRQKRFQHSLFILIAPLGGLFLAILICYPIINTYLRHISKPNLNKYHSFLQITPPKLDVAQNAKKESSNNYSHFRSPFRILTLGGSTTAWKGRGGIGWTDILEEKLNSAQHLPPIQIDNAATEWYTTAHTLINYHLNLSKRSPDLIILMHAINDLLTNADFSYFSNGSFRSDYGHFYGPFRDIFYRQDEPFQLLSSFLQAAWYHTPRKQTYTDNFPGKRSFRRNIEVLINTVNKKHIPIFIMTQPYLYHSSMSDDVYPHLYMIRREAIGPREQWTLKTALEGMQQYNTEVKEIAETSPALFVDLERSIHKTLEYFTDDVHYTDRAHTLIADVLYDELNRYFSLLSE